MQNDTSNNNVTLIGRVIGNTILSHKVFSEGFYLFYICAPRLSENVDILPVTFSERLIAKSEIVPGRFIKVSGQLRSYNYYTEGKSRLVLTVFARELELVDEESTKGENPNEITLNGFICKPPVYRKTPFGREICDLLLAVNRAYNKSDYIPCIVWGRNARFAGLLEVGTNVMLSGRIQSRTYQKRIGETLSERTAYEVSVAKIDKVSEDMPYENSALDED